MKSKPTINGVVKSITRGRFGLEVVIETEPNGQYPNPIMIEVSDKAKDAGLWSDLKDGDAIVAECWLKGREHAGKYYCNPQGYSFERMGPGRQKAPF